jgi:hypothetical protein
MSKKSPMSLSLDYLGKLGYTCQIVERRLPIPGKHVTQDCFGFGDILAFHSDWKRVVLVQTTSWSNFMARKAKIEANVHQNGWKRAGGRIWLHAWGNKGLREEEL